MVSAGRLVGKVAVITGAARGQGAAEARLFAAEGARLIATDITIDDAELSNFAGSEHIVMQHDVADTNSWTAVVNAALSRFGQVDILVNNAGIYRPAPLQETDLASFERFIAVNQIGPFLGMKAIIPTMIERGGGAIINIASTAGLRGSPGMFAYAASKWALRGMSKCAAIDLAPHNIRVNAVLPGAIDTPMLAENPPEIVDWMRSTIPLGRLGTPDDVAGAVLYLASDMAAYVSGAEIAVCGAAFA